MTGALFLPLPRRAGRFPAQPFEIRVGAGERLPQARIFEFELL